VFNLLSLLHLLMLIRRSTYSYCLKLKEKDNIKLLSFLKPEKLPRVIRSITFWKTSFSSLIFLSFFPSCLPITVVYNGLLGKLFCLDQSFESILQPSHSLKKEESKFQLASLRVSKTWIRLFRFWKYQNSGAILVWVNIYSSYVTIFLLPSTLTFLTIFWMGEIYNLFCILL